MNNFSEEIKNYILNKKILILKINGIKLLKN